MKGRHQDKAPAPAPATILIPDEIREILGKPPLIGGEDPAQYEKVFNRIAVELDPKSVWEWFRVRDLVDEIWEMARLRRISASLVDLGMRQVGRKLLLPLMPTSAAADVSALGHEVDRLIAGYHDREVDAEFRINALLAGAGLDIGALTAMALEAKIDTTERVDRMLTSRTKRRDQAIRDLEQSLEMRAAQSKAVDGDIEDIGEREMD